MLSLYKISAVFGSLFVIVVLFVGIFHLDSPKIARQKRFDYARQNSLSSLAYGIEQFAFNNGRVPTSTEEMKTKPEFDYILSQKDPETGVAYEYFHTTSTFSVCAIFSLDNTKEKDRMNQLYSDPYTRFYYHSSGRQCFESSIPKKTEPSDVEEKGMPLQVKSF